MTAPNPVAVITGSASGIGLELARTALARGMRVVVNSRSAEKSARAVDELGGDSARVLSAAADLRREAEVDALVNPGRGALRPDRPVGEQRCRTVLRGGGGHLPQRLARHRGRQPQRRLLCCRAVFPVMQRQSAGCIINISSIAGYRPHPGAAHYAAAKAAVNSLTQTLAVEWAPHGIRVNGVALGPVMTNASRFNDPATRAAMESQQTTGRIATADEVARIVLSLAAIDSSYFTGETVEVDGGYRSVLQSPLPRPERVEGG